MSWEETRKLKISVFKRKYGELAWMWENEKDDRIVFHNMYNIILRALESMKEEPDNYIVVAVNNKIKEDEKIMDEIRERFKGRYAFI